MNSGLSLHTALSLTLSLCLLIAHMCAMLRCHLLTKHNAHSTFTLSPALLVYVIFSFILLFVRSFVRPFSFTWFYPATFSAVLCSIQFNFILLSSLHFTSHCLYSLLFVWRRRAMNALTRLCLCSCKCKCAFIQVAVTASFVFLVDFVFAVYSIDIQVVVADVNSSYTLEIVMFKSPYTRQLEQRTKSKCEMQKSHQTKTQIPKIMLLQISIKSNQMESNEIGSNSHLYVYLWKSS